MSYHYSYRNKTAGVIRYSCGILFLAFSFCYLYFLQGEILAQAQFVFSKGITEYSVLVGAIIIPLVLQFVQWLVSLLSRLPAKFYALTFIPSALMLAMLTDVDETTMHNFTFGAWTWIAPSIIFLYIIAVVIINRFTDSDSYYNLDNKSVAYPNFIILLAIIIAVGSVPTTTDIYHFELKAERLILENDYEGAARVGKKSLRTSERLTQLRMYALSRQGILPDCLFEYPQHYGSAGLLDVADTLDNRRVSAKEICLHLGAFCGTSIKSTDRYMELMMSDTLWNKHTADYYLCGMLLDKKLDQFYENLPKYYNLSDTIIGAYDSLPRYYREALMQIADKDKALFGKIFINGDSITTLSDTVMVAKYKDYSEMKIGIVNKVERINKTHRQHGDTFWWYYDFSNDAIGELANDK